MKKVLFLTMVALSSVAAWSATNDVAQCWAVTKSGNRCKRRAVVNERYCKQHAASRMPSKLPDCCRSMTTNGVSCTAKPLPSCNYCAHHLK